MVHSGAQPPSGCRGAHLVLYDGICGLCSRLLQFLLRHDRRHVFSCASLQSPVGQSMVERNGGNPGELTSFYVIADYQTASSRVFTRSDAALFVAGTLGWPWKAARLMRFVPQRINRAAFHGQPNALATKSAASLLVKTRDDAVW